MRITLLTPGTGHFYCGNCLRENTLAQALREQGHDVTMIPLYLPLFGEEDGPSSSAPVFLGGINLFLQHKIPLIRSLPRFLTGLLDAPGLLRWGSKRGDMTDAAKHAGMALAMIRCDDSGQMKELRRMLAWMRKHDPPDVISLCNVLLAGLAGPIKKELDVPITCTLHGEDSFLDALPEANRDQAWSLLREKTNDIDAFIPVSEYYARRMAERLNLPGDRLHVIHNGIDLDGLTPASPDAREGDPPTIGYLARMCHDKGLPTLIDAFIELKRRDTIEGLRLSVAGVMLKVDRKLVGELEEKLRQAGCRDAAEFRPNLDRADKIDFLRSLDVLSVPATYGESFGLYVIEAMACGVPVVQPRHGAFPEVLDRTGGGLLCEPDDPISLADTLQRLLTDRDLATRLATAGPATVHAHYSAARMAADVAEVYTSLLTSRTPVATSTKASCPA